MKYVRKTLKRSPDRHTVELHEVKEHHESDYERKIRLRTGAEWQRWRGQIESADVREARVRENAEAITENARMRV